MSRPSQNVKICLALGVAALLLDLNTFHQQQTADALMPVLNSLYHWTPFFWGQRYYGMLWPWLAQPIHHPFYNFLVQNALVFCFGLGAHFAVARYLFRQPADLATGALSVVALLTLSSHHWSFTHVGPALFYATPLVLGLGALYAVEARPAAPGAKRQYGLAAALISLACWFNVSTPLPLALLAAGRHPWGAPDVRLGLRQVALLAAGGLLGLGLMHRVALPGPAFGILAPALWPHALYATAQSGWMVLRDGFADWDLFGVPPLLCAALCALAVLARQALRYPKLAPAQRAHLATVGRTLGLCLLFALFTSTQHWAMINDFSIRYWYPAITIVQICLVSAALQPLYAWLQARRQVGERLDVLCLAAMCAVCVLRFGAPSLAHTRAALDRWAGPYTEQVLASQANFIGGDYWKVWPAVLHANLTLYERGLAPQRHVWGIANKAAQQLSTAPPQEFSRARIFVPHGDEAIIDYFARANRASLRLLQRGASFDLVGLAPARP